MEQNFAKYHHVKAIIFSQLNQAVDFWKVQIYTPVVYLHLLTQGMIVTWVSGVDMLTSSRKYFKMLCF